MIGWLLRRCTRNLPDPAWSPTGIKPMERGSWDVSRDHDDPRARRQLMAEVKARRVQAGRRGEPNNNVVEIRRRA